MSDDTSILQTDRGVIVGYGFIPLPEISIDGIRHKMPSALCHIITERKQDDSDDVPADWEGGKYVATCINLKMDGYGATASEALCDMRDNVIEYIFMLLKRYGYSDKTLNNIFKQDLTDPHTKALWDKYNLLVQYYPPEQTASTQSIEAIDKVKPATLCLDHVSNSIGKTNVNKILHLQDLISIDAFPIRSGKQRLQDLISVGMVGKTPKNKARPELSFISTGCMKEA